MKNLILILSFLLCSFLISNESNAQQGYYPGRTVGYYPVISWFPQGISYSPTVLVGPNRRYVRVGGTFGYSAVTSVYTFNMYTGRYQRIR